MITVNMHEAKSRLSELVKTVETTGELVVLCRDGVEVAEIRRRNRRARRLNRLKPHPDLKPLYVAPDFDPVAPLSDAEWPEALR